MLRSVFLIIVHANSGQLKRLIEKLAVDDATIYLQVDLKVDISIFTEYRNIPNLIFIKNRVSVTWGGYSMVQGMINSFKEIIPSFHKDQYVSVISGQDYPLMQNEEMNQFLAQKQGKAFMEYYPIYEVWKEAIPRLEKYHLTNFSFSGKFFVEYAMNKLLPKRTPPKGLTYLGRSQWFTITVEHLKYIVDFMDTNPSIKRFFTFTWGSDEIVFQTILYSSHYKDQMVNNNLRYIDWSQGGASPKILTLSDAEQLKNSGKFFARKFDMNVDSQILDWIDENLLTEKTI
jgi:hypothetical protein